TAYVVADEETIYDRVVAPFNRAFRRYPGLVRPIYGIPGNHDYYDDLVGFNRMFRRAPPQPVDASTKRVLPLDGFERTQDASYLRIRLPGDWELWGTDFWNRAIDYRQRAYFRPHQSRPPTNLILCTPTPPIAHGADLTLPTDRTSLARLLDEPDSDPGA